MAQKQIPKRSEVEKQYTWATEDLYATDALWEEALNDAKAYPERIASFRGRLAQSPEALLEYMQFSDKLRIKVERRGNYAMRKSY
jgi:oligoendopeptidase F